MIRALVLFVGVAGPVMAQDVSFDPAATEACLSTSDGAARFDCVGLAATACMDAPGAESTVGMTGCLGGELDYWDARLNAAYGALMQVEGRVEAEMAEAGSSASKPAEALRDMQRAWIAWRDASCLYERSQWGGGTGGGPASADCAMRLTAAQAMALEDRLAEVAGQ